MPRKNEGTGQKITGTPEEQFIEAHWGVQPKSTKTVSTPALKKKQALVKMGDLRALYLRNADGTTLVLTPKAPYPWVTFGSLDNRIYLVGGNTDAYARAGLWGQVGTSTPIVQIDYVANKGGERVYWYHEHEAPFPRLKILKSGHPSYEGGKYHVEAAGIVG